MFSVICSQRGSENHYGVQGDHRTVHDVSTVCADVGNLVDLLNRYEASEIHIDDIIEDWLGR